MIKDNYKDGILEKEDRCPICRYKLSKRKFGLVCKNWHCPLYWKYYGWTYIGPEKKDQ